MTVKTITTITCDTPACDHTYTVWDASEVIYAEKEAEREGWVMPDSGVDLCPDCVLVMEPA